MKIDSLFVHARQILTMDPARADTGSKDADDLALGVIEDGALAVDGGRIVDAGPTADLVGRYEPGTTTDLGGLVVSPGLVDPHTHLVFAGSRHEEFSLRMRKVPYLQILAQGGGIHSTVTATRAASRSELVELAKPRLRRALRHGVTTLEAKSGYGLDLENEIKLLEVIRELATTTPIRLVPTFLGAHVVPKEHREKRERYVDIVVREMIPRVAAERLAVACDVFLDDGAFTRSEAARILRAAKDVGLGLKVHAGQFSEQHGPELLAELGGSSAEHLEFVSDEGIAAMARAGVVANLLPGAAFSVRSPFPDGRRLIDGGVRVAVATDLNPGTSCTENLPLMAAMAAAHMGLTVAEAWQAMTIHAAASLGLSGEVGGLAPGHRADLAVFRVPDYRTVLYHFGINHVARVYRDGLPVHEERTA